jgi:hypothetical protein
MWKTPFRADQIYDYYPQLQTQKQYIFGEKQIRFLKIFGPISQEGVEKGEDLCSVKVVPFLPAGFYPSSSGPGDICLERQLPMNWSNSCSRKARI